MRRVWAQWRSVRGHRTVICRSGHWDADGRWHSGSAEESRAAWADLVRTIEIALRRSSPAELFELLTSNVAEADTLAALAGWRLWRLINTRRDAHGHGRHVAVAQADHVTVWDEAPAARRDRIRCRTAAEPTPGTYNSQADEARARHRAARVEAKREADQLKAEQYQRWGISIERMAEPEHIHLDLLTAEQEEDQRRAEPEAAARARARQQGDGFRRRKRNESEAERKAAEARANRERWAARFAKHLRPETEPDQ
ncbi:hypothetical protein [Streptomyces sp. MS1.AVA.4]|uniref:Uncharacterized protein n=1 Tax=Streptomyces pratisoli TaxID=3139917 RepID=A0ACC6QV66_9ACTN